MNNRYYAYWELTAAAVLVGSSVVVGKMATARLPVFLSQTVSLTIALLVLIPVLLANRRHSIKITGQDALVLLLQAFLGMFLFRVLLLYGLKYVSAAESGIVTSLTPVFITLLSFLFLKEKVTGRLALGILFSLLGLVTLKLPGLYSLVSDAHVSDSFIGILLVMLAVAGESMLTVLRKKTSDRVSALLGTTYVTFFSLLMFLPFSIVEAMTFDFARVGAEEMGILLYYGVFVTAIAYILWFRGVSRVPAGTAAVYAGCIPASTLLLSYGILHEPFSFAHVAGFGFVFAGIMLVSGFGKTKATLRAKETYG